MPHRASVLAYISSLLLRTLPAIDYDNENYTYDDDAEPDGDAETEEQHVAESGANLSIAIRPTRKGAATRDREEFAAAVLNRKPN